MAVRQFTRAKARGRARAASARSSSAKGSLLTGLRKILGEFDDSIAVLEVVALAVEQIADESPVEVGRFGVSLRHVVKLINGVYEKLDLALVTGQPSGDLEGSPPVTSDRRT